MKKSPDPGQYKTSTNLRARGNLHARYSTHSWFDWVAGRLGLTSGDKVLDIGCGGGWFWSSAADCLPADLRLCLVDTSHGMVSEAIANVKARTNAGEVTGQTADAEALPFADQHFDCALAMHVLYHVPSPQKAVAEMARALRPGGRAVITTNADDNLAELFALGGAAFGCGDTDPAAAIFGISDARALLSRHLRAVTVHQYDDIYAIDNADDIVHYLTSFPPGNSATDRQKAHLAELVARNLHRCGGVLKVRRRGAMICGKKA